MAAKKGFNYTEPDNYFPKKVLEEFFPEVLAKSKTKKATPKTAAKKPATKKSK